ncbi:MAG TPA: Rad52/Rad22 family DNA repair protein [Candidatus Acidoferrum sp.]|nr:Rad52/Rad22 family DNA repair protein [Candidatus Acidoferrum sp.]
MTPTNGHANDTANGSTNAVQQFAPPASDTNIPAALTPNAAKIKELIASLEVPFHPSVIEWRVTNTSKGGSPRGQVMPYADQRAYTDRLNALFTPAGWTRRYAVHTSANFQRSRDQKIVAKVLVTCELTIFGIGSHSATGEEFADDENAATAAEAQSFKRACCCFGLGRYLYYFSGIWVDLDDRKRPTSIPKLPDWATPEGWRRGMRPNAEVASRLSEQTTAGNNGHSDGRDSSHGASFVHSIEQMEQALGKRMYRGLLKTLARVWNPKDIQDPAIQQKVLAHMQAAERGFRRLDAALERVGPEPLTQILRTLKLRLLTQVDNLQTLHQIVLTLEAVAQERAAAKQ